MSWLLAAVAVIVLTAVAPRAVGCLVTIAAAIAMFLTVLGYYLLGGLDSRLDFGGAALLGLAIALATTWLGYQTLSRRRR